MSDAGDATSDLPLYRLFTRLRELGLPLGIGEYLVLLRALFAGHGLRDQQSLLRLCQTIWASSPEDAALIAGCFQKARRSPTDPAGAPAGRPPSIAPSSAALSPDPRVDPELPVEATSPASARGADQAGSSDNHAPASPSNDGAPATMPIAAAPLVRPRHARTTGAAARGAVVRAFHPLSPRQTKQSLRHLRDMVRTGPSVELDVQATLRQLADHGMLGDLVLRPRRVNGAAVVFLVDHGGSMDPFEDVVREVLDHARSAHLASTTEYYFHDNFAGTLAREPRGQTPVPPDALLRQLGPRIAVVILSDAGAARRSLDLRRAVETQVFVDELRARTRRVVWLNPLPRERWTGTTAQLVADRIPMFELSRSEVDKSIDVLRGRLRRPPRAVGTPTRASPGMVRDADSLERRFGRAHLALACHAALPLTLTAGLLYSLWARFRADTRGRDLAIPWLAVPDLLLSRLWTPSGVGAQDRTRYEMPLSVRSDLLQRLVADPALGLQRIREVAEHCRDQLDRTQPDELDEYRNLQRCATDAFLHPHHAPPSLVDRAQRLAPNDRGGAAHLVRLVAALAPASGIGLDAGIAGALGAIARGNLALAQGRRDQARTEFAPWLATGVVPVGRFTVEVPAELRQPRGPELRPRDPRSPGHVSGGPGGAGSRRALILCPDYDLLAGFHTSADCMAQVLRARGFEVEMCRGADATRAGILSAYDGLIARTNADDAIVIYYVGHGATTVNSTYGPGSELPRFIHNICPTDYAATTDDDFRGISDWEFALLLAELTRKTENVTVIFECSFAGTMSHGDDAPFPQPAPPNAPPEGSAPSKPPDRATGALPAVIPLRPKLTHAGVTKHLHYLRERSSGSLPLELPQNRYAVRLTASGGNECSYQTQLPPAAVLRAHGLDLPDRGWIGAMTLRLAEILAEIGLAHVSWRSVFSKLRERLAVQRPEIEGPIDRLPFSLVTVMAGIFPVRSEHATAILEAGSLQGVSLGDVYGVMPAGSSAFDPATLIERITIDEVAAIQARARRSGWRTGAPELPAGAVALPISLAFSRYAVRVTADRDRQPTLLSALESSRHVRAATPDDRDTVAELRVARDNIVVHDALGLALTSGSYPNGLRDALHDLENLAIERRLRKLPEHGRIEPSDVRVELLVIHDGRTRAVADHGAPVGLDDRIALRLENHTNELVYAHVFNLGLRRRIVQLSTYAMSGIALRPRHPEYVGSSAVDEIAGFELSWPTGLPRDKPRLDTLLVVLTPEPADLSVLESQAREESKRWALSPLQQLFDEIATGSARAVTSGATDAPTLCWRDYRLFPLDGSLDFGVPEVDASPGGSNSPPASVAVLTIRLDELQLAPHTRVDVLVCARSRQSPYHAATVVGDAATELVAWTGVLAGPAEIYLWTSRPTADHRALSELLTNDVTAAPVAALRAAQDDPRSELAAGSSMQLAAVAFASLHTHASNVVTAFRGMFGPGDHGAHRYRTGSLTFTIAIEQQSP